MTDSIAPLRELTAGLFYPSEEDADLEVVELGAAETVRDSVLAAIPDVDELPLDRFFAAASLGGFAAAFPENAAGFERLRAWLDDKATDLAAFRAGDTRLVAGRLADGRIFAVTTAVVET